MAKKVSKNVAKARTAVAVEVTQKSKTVKKARVVSFKTVTVNKRRTFTPVNKRAKAFAVIAGNTKLTLKHLKAIKELGFRVVESGSELTAIAL